LSPDGKHALITARTTARLWEIASGKPAGIPLQHRKEIRAIAFSPDGKVILTGGMDGEARLWDAATSKPLGEPMHHSGGVYAAAFSPDGKVILTGAEDGTAWFWDTAIGRPIAGLLRHQDMILQASFSRDGRIAMTRSYDSTVRLWRVPSPIGATADRIELWAKMITGMELDTSNVIHELEDRTRQEVQQELESLGGSPFPPNGATLLSGEAQREFLVSKYKARGEANAGRGRWEEAIADYTWADHAALRDVPDLLYDLACAHAQCSKPDRPAPAGGEHTRKTDYRWHNDHAMNALRRAVAAGFKNLAHMRRDTDLEPLRTRADFQALMMDLAFPADPFMR
jgi:hypothetical protein